MLTIMLYTWWACLLIILNGKVMWRLSVLLLMMVMMIRFCLWKTKNHEWSTILSLSSTISFLFYIYYRLLLKIRWIRVRTSPSRSLLLQKGSALIKGKIVGAVRFSCIQCFTCVIFHERLLIVSVSRRALVGSIEPLMVVVMMPVMLLLSIRLFSTIPSRCNVVSAVWCR